jgi:DNA invertase Pin-like site-specific DNA recombinase
MKIGYARVSTVGQDLETQIEKLKLSGVEEKDIFIEKISGKTRQNREALKEAMRFARKGDTILVTKIDRLARSILDLNAIVKELIENGVSIHFIDHNMIFKAGAEQDPFQTLLFNTLGSFAQFERDMIVSRTGEGRERAKAQGKRLGRKGQPPKNIERALKLYSERETNLMTISDIVKLTNVPRSTIYAEIKKLIDIQLDK